MQPPCDCAQSLPNYDLALLVLFYKRDQIVDLIWYKGKSRESNAFLNRHILGRDMPVPFENFDQPRDADPPAGECYRLRLARPAEQELP